ncbi:hypothetical protein [Caballeronia sp. LZ016]|uniref:hypothetical protein n=1 Tax=Caballeronia sp. LZ016 TaxID=3038554 RepID=UPI002861D15C|nr:hypothetical protein [Caballeronia sp. LZ016]MDR5740136.1 hypothetical protein [Caballeronia sp. LZ016]
MTTNEHELLQGSSTDHRIADCHRMIEAQSERLAKAIFSGADPTQARVVLYCLKGSLSALEASKAAIALDVRASIHQSLFGTPNKSKTK